MGPKETQDLDVRLTRLEVKFDSMAEILHEIKVLITNSEERSFHIRNNCNKRMGRLEQEVAGFKRLLWVAGFVTSAAFSAVIAWVKGV